MTDPRDPAKTPLAPIPETLPVEPEAEPPVVARLVIEIRSDGTRTIARGGIEDVQLGERVAIVAEGTTPLALAGQLVRSIFQAPALIRAAARALLPKGKDRP